MSDRDPPTTSSLKRGGVQHFGQEKRRTLTIKNAMTNIVFRSEEIFSVNGLAIEPGITNFTEKYKADLKCTNDSSNCQLRVLENGQILLESSIHDLNEVVTIGRNNRVFGVLTINNNRVKINNTWEFGSFPLNDKNEHVAILMPPGKIPNLIKSNFLHINFGRQPVVVQFEISIDGGLFLSLVLTQTVLAFTRFDSASLNTTLAQMFRAISIHELSEMKHIDTFVERFLGQPGLRAIRNRQDKLRETSEAIDGTFDRLAGDADIHTQANFPSISQASKLVIAEIHNPPADSDDDPINDFVAQNSSQQLVAVDSSPVLDSVAKPITGAADIKTYVILLGGTRFHSIPKVENVFRLGHLVTGHVKLPEETANEQFHWGGPNMNLVTREFVQSQISAAQSFAQSAKPFVPAQLEKKESLSSSSVPSVQTVFEISRNPYADDPAKEWESE